MVAEPGRKVPGSLPHAIGTTIPGRSIRSRSRSPSARSTTVGFWLVELLLLAGIAGGAGGPSIQEICYYQSPNVVHETGKWKVRYLHTILVETSERVGKLKWARSDRVVKATLTVREKDKRRKKRSREQKQLVVLVPAGWKLIDKIEKLRDNTDKEVISDLVANWGFTQFLDYFDFEPNHSEKTPTLTTRTYRPYISYLAAMAEESLQKISQALERLSVSQSSTSWSRHLKTPDIFKPDTRDNELKQWSDWKFSFENYVKGIGPGMAHSMRLVEENLNGSYELDASIRLYSLLLPQEPTAEADQAHEAGERIRGLAAAPTRDAAGHKSPAFGSVDPVVSGAIRRRKVHIRATLSMSMRGFQGMTAPMTPKWPPSFKLYQRI